MALYLLLLISEMQEHRQPVTTRGEVISVSVVVATRDRHELLRRCLHSLRESRYPPAEIIVVDSASREPSYTLAVASEFGASVVLTDIPGAGHARNLGAHVASSRVIAFTDDDAWVDPDWVGEIAAGFHDDVVDAVVGPVWVDDANIQKVMELPRHCAPGPDREIFSRKYPDWFDRLAFGGIGLGANLAVRRSRFRDRALFRPCLGAGAPIGGDETYFLFNLVARGGTVVNLPDAKVYHPAQSPARINEISRSSLAYLLLLLANNPRLLAKFTRRLLRRRRPIVQARSDDKGAARANRSLNAFRQFVAVPGLLLAAWRHERLVSQANTSSRAIS